MWVDEARPGFMDPQTVKIAYLTADYETFGGDFPTDDEVKAYYESHKERYRVTQPKRSEAPDFPDDKASSKDEPASKDDDKEPKEKDADKGDSKQESTPEKESAADKPDPDTKKPEQDDPKSSCGGQAEESAKPANADESKDSKDPGTSSKTTEKVDGPADATQPENGVRPLAELPVPEPSPVKYRELDDDLKFDIQKAILKERAFEKIAIALDKAYDFMRPLGVDYDTAINSIPRKDGVEPDAATQKDINAIREKYGKEISAKLKQYAKDRHLIYAETDELTHEELVRELVGMAVDKREKITVAAAVFKPNEPIYSPRRADLRSGSSGYAFWKIGETPAHVADLAQEKIRERAIKAWKFNEARALAKKRAEVLVAKIKSQANNLPVALTGESASGSPDAPALSVMETPDFSWLSGGLNWMQPAPRISDVPPIGDVDNDFMKTVFEELNEGEVGVVSDDVKKTFYVVKVKSREMSKDIGGVEAFDRQKAYMSEKFFGEPPFNFSPYLELAQMPQSQIDQNWLRKQDSDYNVELDEPAPSRRSR
jgi:hypothetical protein